MNFRLDLTSKKLDLAFFNVSNTNLFYPIALKQNDGWNEPDNSHTDPDSQYGNQFCKSEKREKF